MIWRIDVTPRPGCRDAAGEAAREALNEGGISGVQEIASSRLYLIEGPDDTPLFRATAERLLSDPVVERCRRGPAAEPPVVPAGVSVFLVFKKPGVMDPVEASAIKAFRDSGVSVGAVRTGIRYEIRGGGTDLRAAVGRLLANEVVDEVFVGERPFHRLQLGSPATFRKVTIPLVSAGPEELSGISRRLHLSLDRKEMETIRDHFRTEGRDPSDAELETIAQTWSEHCKHKTLRGEITAGGKTYRNLLKSTIMKVTEDLAKPWCVSVFRDNAGIIEFDERNNVCIKVETHNHPSALEPYGGAGTGLGGVIRDVLGCGLGAKPVAGTDVFCVAPPDLPKDRVPSGVLHPRRLLRGVVSGVRDYGNRMGIPTVNGAVLFDERYLSNPLVYCGTVGILPKECSFKKVEPGDLIVVVGGRTGRDGIHGATFSSAALTDASESVSGGAVQIGNAIVEKRMLDTLLQARDRKLYRAVTDCGAGGLSSAVGEMGEECGAEVDLDLVPLKYEGLTYSEIWISEAQERMVLAVPPERREELLAVFAAEDVEATVIGRFTSDHRLRLRYRGEEVGDLDMNFLHHGVPPVVKRGEIRTVRNPDPVFPEPRNLSESILGLLSSWNVCSKEWVIRQYDHEVQGGSVLKPLVGVHRDAPGDAAVVRPDLQSRKALAIGCGMNPLYGDLDSYAMAVSAVDEALRNVVAVGGDPDRTAILDNFSWGDVEDPVALGALVRACEGCADAARLYGTPFISGKDSLHNVYDSGGVRRSIPHSLLITALSIVPDADRCVSMDLKEAGNVLYLLGTTHRELGGSHYYRQQGATGGTPPGVRQGVTAEFFRNLHEAIRLGLVRSCHDLSEGGLAVAAAEMVIGGNLGLSLDLRQAACGEGVERDDQVLFSESNSRFVVEVRKSDAPRFESLSKGAARLLGPVTEKARLEIRGREGRVVADLTVDELRSAWKKPLERL